MIVISTILSVYVIPCMGNCNILSSIGIRHGNFNIHIVL